MLILTRRTGEAILMDGGVRIVVLGTDSGGVRLGIEAPPSVGILREEVVQRIAEENIRAGVAEGTTDILKSLSEGEKPKGPKDPPVPRDPEDTP
jgi:carbon storage regulator